MRARETKMGENCQTCGDAATQWDYDQLMYFCDRHVQQADFTVPLEDRRPPAGHLCGDLPHGCDQDPLAHEWSGKVSKPKGT